MAAELLQCPATIHKLFVENGESTDGVGACCGEAKVAQPWHLLGVYDTCFVCHEWDSWQRKLHHYTTHT